jgi:hypothetical protein
LHRRDGKGVAGCHHAHKAAHHRPSFGNARCHLIPFGDHIIDAKRPRLKSRKELCRIERLCGVGSIDIALNSVNKDIQMDQFVPDSFVPLNVEFVK